MNLPHMKSPCSNCPFTVNCRPGWLGSARMEEILTEDSFVCHKTAQGKKSDRLQCAGHMIIKGNENAFVNLANRLGFELPLSGKERVFKSEDEAIKHHSSDE